MFMAEDTKNKNPFQYFWELATGGLFSDGSGSDQELTPDKNAGQKHKQRSGSPKIKTKGTSKHSHIDAGNHKKAG